MAQALPVFLNRRLSILAHWMAGLGANFPRMSAREGQRPSLRLALAHRDHRICRFNSRVDLPAVALFSGVQAATRCDRPSGPAASIWTI